jgi:uncharacterized protein
MPAKVTPFDPGAECGWIARRFRHTMAALSPQDAPADADPGIAPDNIVILLPYALAEAFPFQGGAEAARAMALGNAFGAAHFLAQDRVLDGEDSVTPGACLRADGCLFAFLREYARLLEPLSAFWGHLDRYLGEYFASLSWEREVLRTARGASAVAEGDMEATLIQLGRRMSPLKATGAAFAELADAPELLVRTESVIEEFHAAYQLQDDLQDLESDLASARWSTAAWIIAVAGGVDLISGQHTAEDLLVIGARTGALRRISDLIASRYRLAASEAEALGASVLAAHLRERLQRSQGLLEHTASRLAVASVAGSTGPMRQPDISCPASPGVSRPAALGDVAARLHSFSVGGRGFVYDRCSGLFFETDAKAADVIDWLRRGADPAALNVLRMNHGDAGVDEALVELAVLNEGKNRPPAHLNAPPQCEVACATQDDVGERASLSDHFGETVTCPTLGPVVTLALNVSDNCNLACDYCYLGANGRRDADRRLDVLSQSHACSAGDDGLMSLETADRAVDLLFSESFGARELSLVFFGGEPLLNVELIEHVAVRATECARNSGRSIRLSMTTNGTLLTPRVFASLRRVGVSVLVSIDGDRPIHDAHRTTRDGNGSYDTVVANVRAILASHGCANDHAGARLTARSTVTRDSGLLPEIVSHLRRLGFRTVYLSPVSGVPLEPDFARSLMEGFEALVHSELEALLGGRPPSVGNFLEPLVALELGRRRLAPCGAGTRYVSVSHDGRLYLCHRFVGNADYAVGDVVSGLDRRAAARLLKRLGRPAACEGCWALGLCGGPCFHDLSSDGQTDCEARVDRLGREACRSTDLRCAVTKRVLELSMWLYASLPQAVRQEFARKAKGLLRAHSHPV